MYWIPDTFTGTDDNKKLRLVAGTGVAAMVISCGRFLPVNGDGKENASLKLQCYFKMCDTKSSGIHRDTRGKLCGNKEKKNMYQ